MPAGGKLAQVLAAISEQFALIKPKTALDAARVINEAVKKVGVEPGFAKFAADGTITLINAAGVVTTLGIDGPSW